MEARFCSLPKCALALRQNVVALAAAALLGNMGLAWAEPPVVSESSAAVEMDPKAIAALKGMGGYLRTLKAFAVRAEVTKDEVLLNGQKIQFASRVGIQTRLPDRLRVDIQADIKDREFYFDGKTVTLYAPAFKYYASVPAPATVREMLVEATTTYDLELPLADLFLWGSDQAGFEDIKSAIYVGPSHIDGALCDHYAFQQNGVDWQIWIEHGAKALPRKLLITTLDEASQPQYSAVLKWDLAPRFKDKTFTYVPGKDARKIVLTRMATGKGEQQ